MSLNASSLATARVPHYVLQPITGSRECFRPLPGTPLPGELSAQNHLHKFFDACLKRPGSSFMRSCRTVVWRTAARKYSSVCSSLDRSPESLLQPRRAVLLHLCLSGSALVAGGVAIGNQVAYPEAAEAFSIGFSGPKDWLREQKKRSSPTLFKPIQASRKRLEAMSVLLEGGGLDSAAYEEATYLLHLASQDCTVPDSGSFLDLQKKTGIEVCTFALVLKNAASLLEDDDEIKLAAEASLKDVILAFEDLSEQLETQMGGSSDDRKGVVAAVASTQGYLNQFEGSIRAVLGLPPDATLVGPPTRVAFS
eukprot:TRINITY_DN6494_c0_g1_i1.p1 TRINITY_DN6494_c0_g1~~TRINITY_DN6494_c0_g1_i1.p1  ORF type:complete len:309 (+),score=46.83 TRINITY_DN6494_c0_g1_i1:154-1080(+)